MYKFKNNYAEKISESTDIGIQSQHWGGNRQISMEGIAVKYFSSSFVPGYNRVKSEFRSFISDKNEQYACE